MKKSIIVCVDNPSLIEPLADYAIYLSNNTGLPLIFLNVVEPTADVQIDLSGNLTLGQREDLLEEFTSHDEKQSKQKVKAGRELLELIRKRAIGKTEQEIIIKQFHGTFIDTLKELEDESRLFVIGLLSAKKGNIGRQVVESIKQVDVPFFLVSSDFVEPKTLLIESNGSKEALKLFHNFADAPLFGNIKRDIVAIDTDSKNSSKFLSDAKSIFDSKNIPISVHAIEGSPQEELLAFFEQNSYDILARGAFSKSLLKELFFGSLTEDILNKTSKPLLLLK